MKINIIVLIVFLLSISFSGCTQDSSSLEESGSNPLIDSPSDNYQNTQEITLNTEVTGDLEVSDDIDYFKFTLNQQTTVEFEKQTTNGTIGQVAYLGFEVYDVAKNSLLDIFTSSSTRKHSLTLNTGTYYIKVSTISSDITGYRFVLNGIEGTVISDDYPNDSAKAHSIDLNVEIIGDLELSNDIDYFKFILNQQTTIEFEKQTTLGSVGQVSYADFNVYDNSNNSLLSIFTSSSTEKHSLTLNAGTYYINLKTISNDITGYRFSLNGTEGTVTSDDYPNNSGNAHDIDLNIEVTGNLELSNDVDYFKLTLNQLTTIEFEKQTTLGNVGQVSYADFNVYDNLNNSLLSIFTSSSTEKHFLTLNTGTYYIKVSTISNDITGYRFILHGSEGTVISDDYPNNSGNAHTIDLNIEVTGGLELSTDIDYFKFTLNQQTTIEFEKQTTNGTVGQVAYLGFDVYDNMNNKLLDIFTSSSIEKHFLTLNIGTYYIKISTISSDITGYRFVLNGIEGTVISDDYSNDTANAHAIDLNVEVTGDLELSNDIDYFKFTLNQQATVEFEKQTTNGTVGQVAYLGFEVYDNMNNKLLDIFTSSSTEKHSLALNAGTYYIKVSTISNDITGYRFILNF